MRVAIIPARGGSRRIPRKNIRLFHGKPIIAYSIQAAKDSELFDEVYVSTEDDEIAEVAYGYGAEILWRGLRLAQDEVGTQEVMRVAMLLAQIKQPKAIEGACCIYPCAPMLTGDDLVRAYNVMMDGYKGFPRTVADSYVLVPGWYYWGRAEWFIEGRPIDDDSWVEALPSGRYIDINTPEDWARAEEMYRSLFAPATASNFILNGVGQANEDE